MENIITVLLVPINEKPRLIEIENNFDSMKKIVGEPFEEYAPFDDGAVFILNEKKKFYNTELNRTVYDENGEIIDVICGDFFIAYANELDRFIRSIPSYLSEKYKKMFCEPENYSSANTVE